MPRDLIKEVIITRAKEVVLLIKEGILTKEDIRKLLGLEKKKKKS